MIVVTTNNIEGGTIKRYIDSICANTVVGTNIFSDFAASFTDFFGGKSSSYKKKLDLIYEDARKELEMKAVHMGANAIIGFRVDFDEISGKDKSMFMVSVSGTACLVEYENDINTEKVGEISDSIVGEEVEKLLIIEKINQGYALKERWIEILAKLHPKEAIKPLISLYEKYSKDSSDSIDKIEGIFLYYPSIDLIEEVYKKYEDSGFNEIICNLITNCNLFDAESIFHILKKNLHAGIKLLKAKENSYCLNELHKMEEICDYLESLPNTGRIDLVKSGLLKKEEEMFICENGHKNKKDSVFCENSNCCVNIKGLKPVEVRIIDDFKRKTSVIKKLLS